VRDRIREDVRSTFRPARLLCLVPKTNCISIARVAWSFAAEKTEALEGCNEREPLLLDKSAKRRRNHPCAIDQAEHCGQGQVTR